MKTLLVIDIQNDFCEGGALEILGANKNYIQKVNQCLENYDLIIATQDSHPPNHSSFKINNPESGIWQIHCVKNTFGWQFHPELNTNKFNKIFLKGENPNVDSYSGFLDNDHVSSTGLHEYLQKQEITEITIIGLALDYCVKFTALDAAKTYHYDTTILQEYCLSVNLNTVSETITELKSNGVKVI